MTSAAIQPVSAYLLIPVFIVGAILAAFANYCVDRLDWTPRYRSPWRRFPKEMQEQGALPTRTWLDRTPILGWIRLSRFAFANASDAPKNSTKSKKRKPDDEKASPFAWIPGWESRLFWLRPLFVEFLFALLVAWRFQYWHGAASGLTWGPFSLSFIAWGVETLLFWLALCASLVDLDDYVIPDAIVLPGAILALCAAALFPPLIAPPLETPIVWSFNDIGGPSTLSVCLYTAGVLVKHGYALTLANVRLCVGVALSCIWTLWSFALLDRRFYLRLGFLRACVVFARRLRRSSLTPVVAILWILGLAGIWFVVFRFASLDSCHAYSFNSLDALCNSFIGLLVGTMLIWIVRLLGGWILGVEAMGFGDVVLSGMLGAFIGWKGVFAVFFIAPFFGLAFGLIRRCFNTAREIPYGPFLCAATVLYLVCRAQIDPLLSILDHPFVFINVGIVGIGGLAAALTLLRIVKAIRKLS